MIPSSTKPFRPDYAVSPGQTLAESLQSMHWTQTELAARSGLHRKTINGIINGREPITPDTAIRLEKVFGVPIRFWLNLQSNYEEARARLKERNRLGRYSNWLRKAGIPVGELVRRGVIPPVKDPVEKLGAVLRLFGVASPEQFPSVCAGLLGEVRCRKSESHGVSEGAVATWLRLGEIDARDVACRPFDRDALRRALPRLRCLVVQPGRGTWNTLVDLCSSAGVAVVVIPGIRKAPIYGATRWLGSTKALLQLSLRGKDDGHVWFTFFHELGHILLHGRNEVFVDMEEGAAGYKEKEADAFARETLIPRTDWESFLRTHPYRNTQGYRKIAKEDIRRFADEINVTPGVVVGRLQRDSEIPWTHCNDLKIRIRLTSRSHPSNRMSNAAALVP